ncbi:MAG: hypothetical protein KDB86_07460 [Actinobacteria bacterium]|nr:hypothetical protein [Actinomycetota bacterium]MCB9389702.1 hypothetical protein [Acidimicrobiia bacterium]
MNAHLDVETVVTGRAFEFVNRHGVSLLDGSFVSLASSLIGVVDSRLAMADGVVIVVASAERSQTGNGRPRPSPARWTKAERKLLPAKHSTKLHAFLIRVDTLQE